MTRRSIVALFSVCVHAIILLFAMTADLWRPITEWPTPRSAMAFESLDARPVHVEDSQLPPTTERRPTATALIEATSPGEAAPVVAPDGVADETGGERSFSTLPPGPPTIENAAELGTIAVPSMPPPAPIVVEQKTPIRLSSGIRPPQRLNDVRPTYPAVARAAHVEGVVIMEIVVDDQGHVSKAQILRSVPLLDAAALDAVRQWTFLPTKLNGSAVPIVMTVTVNFTLKD